jgi:branched-chain amino acid transport system permease protein
MNDFLHAYLPLFNIFLINSGLALSQYIVLRAGVESFATPAMAGIGAYTAVVLAIDHGVPVGMAIALAGVAGALVGGLLSIPLARLRSTFQAIATIAFVQIVVSLILYADSFTKGALGINGIPRIVDTDVLLLYLIVVVVVILVVNRTSIGRAFDAIRQEETVAVALGISVVKYHALAFVMSGVIAAVGGALMAFNTYSIAPDQFGFSLLVTVITAVVLGGRHSVVGPIVGAAALAVLPEIARPLADQRMLIYGITLVLIIIYLPRGIADSLLGLWQSRRTSRRAVQAAAKAGGQP